MGLRVLDGEVLLDEGADEPQQAFAVVAGLEVHPTLRARKRAAMQGDQGQPFGLAAGPSEGRELAGAVLQRRDRGGALGARVDLGRAAGHRVTSARSPRPSGLRSPLGLTIIGSGSRVGTHGQGRARVQRSRRRRGADLRTARGRVFLRQRAVLLRDLLFAVADRPHEVIGDVLGVGGGLVDFPWVLVQRRDPALDVRRASAAVVTDAHTVAGQHGRHFDPEFFAGVLHAAEVPDTVLERVAVQAQRVAGRVAEFVHRDLVIPVRGRQLLTLRECHLVGLHVVTGPVAAYVGDVNPALLNHSLGCLVGLPLGLVVLVVAPVERHVVRLFDVEHGVDTDHRRAGLFLLGRARLLLLEGELILVEN